MTSELQAKIDAMKEQFSEDYTWGVRFDVDGLPVGHIFPASRVWDDGEPTDEMLPGTSVIEDGSLNRIDGDYLGTAYIVCGLRVANGQDSGEVILAECEVMAI